MQSFEDAMKHVAVSGVGEDSNANDGASEDGLLAVVKFHANWCPQCQALAPAMRIFALKIPTVRVFSVDIDDCDGLAERYVCRNHLIYGVCAIVFGSLKCEGLAC